MNPYLFDPMGRYAPRPLRGGRAPHTDPRPGRGTAWSGLVAILIGEGRNIRSAWRLRLAPWKNGAATDPVAGPEPQCCA
jgi:hypothetical protein